MHNYCRVGIDIGGTGVKGVAINEQGKSLTSFDIPTSNFDDNPIENLVNHVFLAIGSNLGNKINNIGSIS